MNKSPTGLPKKDVQYANEVRILEIASMLPLRPTGIGRPASDREAWNKLEESPAAKTILQEAAGYVDTPPPELPDKLYLEFTRTGNRTHYQRPYGHRVKRLQTLLLAECLEYTGRFLKPLERDVLAMCNERSWTMPAHDPKLTNFNGTRLTIDLGSSARGRLLSCVDYWLGEKLNPDVRTQLRAEVQRRIFDPYLNSVRGNNLHGNWWIQGDNNWNAVCTAGVAGAALALVDSPRDRAEFLAAMESSIPYFLSGFTNDGYCSEGMGYWNYGFGHFLMMGLSVRAATNGQLDLFQGEKLARIAAYAGKYRIQPGSSPHFADGGGNPDSHVWALLRQVYPEAVPGDAERPDLLSGGTTGIGLRAFGQEPLSAEGSTPALPIRDWFADAQVLITRSAVGEARPFGGALKGGHNGEHHNHNDIGSYAIVLDGVEMLGDPGGEIYTRRTFSKDRYDSKVLNSYGHPVPMVANTLQPTGRASAARVLAAEFCDMRDALLLDLSAAYRVPELTSLTRRFCHDRGQRCIEIIDAVKFTEPKDFNTPLISCNKVHRKSDNTLLLYSEQHCVRVTISVEGGPWQIREEAIGNPGRPSPKRLAVAFTDPVSTAQVRFMIEPCEMPDGLP